ncbi:unnamed protein product [Angiostrongylus costaricensis]|uniref:BLM10_mid domain-containing protein n=1 Tax=Angiostrongylus costaricensis TaxID=334426 RepID=A0A158PEQ5_ANGCS|nr:unnamed protein product [Angiostrongylus costaricensis]
MTSFRCSVSVAQTRLKNQQTFMLHPRVLGVLLDREDERRVWKPSFVVVDAGVNVERDKARKYGRHEKKFVLLPYHEQLSNYLDDYFEHIKHGLVISVLVNENRPALRNYMLALRKFVEANGFRFSKGDHLKLIQLLYLVMVKKDQWHDVVHYAAKALEKLLNKCYFNHNDLVLEWEPAYDLYYGAAFGKLENVESNRIRTAIFRLKRFYKPSDSAKIWKRVPKQFYLTDTDTKLFVEATIQSLLYSLYSKDGKNGDNLTLIFYIMPILDYSECVKYHKDLTADEKSLCLMSARLPLLAELALDRMLEVIQSLSITSPKDSSSQLGSFKDEATKESVEEKVLKKGIDRCVAALFTNTAASITSKMAKKVFNFMKTNQFESQLATDMISSLISQMTYASPSFWLPFADHVLRNLRELLTPEVKNAEDLGTSTQWFVTLAGSLLSTTSENYICNKEICFEMIKLLLDCRNKVAYSSGCNGLWYMLHMLSRIYPENSRYVAERLNRPLSEWVPIREWSKVYNFRETKMAWHVPNEKSKELVEALLTKFLFPTIESLKNKDMDRESRESLKKAITILNYGFSGAATCFAMPSSTIFTSSNTMLPWYNTNSVNPSAVQWDIRSSSGRNFREELVETLENVIERLVSSKREHSQVLSNISRILYNVIRTSRTDSNELDIAVGEHSDIYAYLTTPISKKWQIFVLESQAYRNVVESPTALFTSFHLKVFRILARLTINDYSEVRSETLSVLAELFKEYSIARESIVDDILPVLTNPESTKEQLKGALGLISQAGWATRSTVSTKTKVWKAIIEMKVMDDPDVIELYDDLWNDIGKIKKPARKHYVR